MAITATSPDPPDQSGIVPFMDSWARAQVLRNAKKNVIFIMSMPLVGLTFHHIPARLL